jgi:hypothetical protein
MAHQTAFPTAAVSGQDGLAFAKMANDFELAIFGIFGVV